MARIKNPFWIDFPCEPEKNAFHTSIVYKDYIITIDCSERENGPEEDLVVINMQTHDWEDVRYIGEERIPKTNYHCACLKNENTIVMFGGDDLEEDAEINTVLITINDTPGNNHLLGKYNTIN